jgi:hypothetical protein
MKIFKYFPSKKSTDFLDKLKDLGLQLWAGLICDGTRRFPKVREGEPNFFAELAHPLVEIISITERLELIIHLLY